MVVQLKGNHPRLREAVHRHCLAQPSDSRWAGTGKRHGRYEYRQVCAFALPPGSGTEDWHDAFVSVLQVTRVTQVPARSLNGWHTRSSETAYYLSTAPLTAAQGAQMIQAHWHIENRLHHVLDVSLEEDGCRTRHNAGIRARLRRGVLNLMRHNGETSISDACYCNALDIDRLLNYKGL